MILSRGKKNKKTKPKTAGDTNNMNPEGHFSHFTDEGLNWLPMRAEDTADWRAVCCVRVLGLPAN